MKFCLIAIICLWSVVSLSDELPVADQQVYVGEISTIFYFEKFDSHSYIQMSEETTVKVYRDALPGESNEDVLPFFELGPSYHTTKSIIFKVIDDSLLRWIDVLLDENKVIPVKSLKVKMATAPVDNVLDIQELLISSQTVKNIYSQRYAGISTSVFDAFYSTINDLTLLSVLLGTVDFSYSVAPSGITCISESKLLKCAHIVEVKYIVIGDGLLEGPSEESEEKLEEVKGVQVLRSV